MTGCRHIQQVFENEKSKEGVLKTCNAARYMLTHFSAKDKYLHAMTCSKCHEINRGTTFMCLQCGFCGCWNNSHFLTHSKKVGHVFGISSSNGLLFCFKCGDYIGDVELIMVSMLNKHWEDVSLKTVVPKMNQRDGLSGLLNMGSTCFMSSILQCLIRNPYFFQFSISHSHSKICPVQDMSSCISCALEQMVHQFYGSPYKHQEPYAGFIGLLTSSWKRNENLAGYSQQDAHEFWQFLLNQIHNDYLRCHNKENDKQHNDVLCECVAHLSFQGLLKSSIVCPACHNIFRTTFDPFMDLSLNIKDKSTLYNCLDSFHKEEQLHDFDYHCDICNTSEDAIKQLSVYKLPPVLVLQLKRSEHLLNGNSVKLDNFVEYPSYLNMKNYLDNEDTMRMTPDVIYELIGVVSHKGSASEGHYIAITKVSGGQWFKFNDSMVYSLTEKEALSEQAYLLFYAALQVN